MRQAAYDKARQKAVARQRSGAADMDPELDEDEVGSGFRVYGLGFMVYGLGFRVIVWVKGLGLGLSRS